MRIIRAFLLVLSFFFVHPVVAGNLVDARWLSPGTFTANGTWPCA